MKIKLLTTLALLAGVLCYGQSKDKIVYVFSDAVERTVDSCIRKSGGPVPGFQFYLVLEADSSLYSLTIGKYTKSEQKNILPWIKQTNRYMIVSDRSIPLIFDHDFKFGARWNDKIGEFGHRDDNIIRVNLLLHGTTIFFDHAGKIVRLVD